MSALAVGMHLNDRFTLRGIIGVGGMAEVWRADDAVLGRAVAVKVLTASPAADAQFRSATFAEARAAARLSHPHVTQVHDYGEAVLPDGDVLPFLVLELVDGETLFDRLRTGPLPWRQAALITSQVASALAAAHRLGIVHRDIKPANVMQTRTGAKILDFGIASRVGAEPGPYAGRLAGTPAYAAPELLQSRPATPASDVYALGALLYEALTGRPPITAADWQRAADAHRVGTPIAPPEAPGLPRQLSRLCMACLAADPAERPRADELARDLSAVADLPLPPTPPGTPAPTLVGGAPLNGGYAIGAARLPSPPTMVDTVMSASGHDSPPARRPAWHMTAIVAAAVVVAVVATILIGSAVRPGPAKQAAPPPLATIASDKPSPAPSPVITPAPTATSPQDVIDQLTAAINSDQAAGKIDKDSADSLRDKVEDLRHSLNGDGDGGHHGKQHKLADKAQDLRDKIDELAHDGDVDQQTADQLTAILAPLLDEQ